MRLMKRNLSAFYYSLRSNDSGDIDTYGNPKISFSSPVQMKANISPASGSVQVEQFGSTRQYDKVIVTDCMDCPIDETSVLFLDGEPTFDDNGNPLYDYIVRRVARSLNSIAYAVSKVTVS